MARNIPESKEITVFAILRQGNPSSTKVTFVFLQDGAELDRVEGNLSDADVRTGKAAICKYTPPAVPNDKPKYLLEYYVIADGDEYRNSEEIHVWPHKVKVETRTEDGSKALPNLRFKPGLAGVAPSGQDEAPAIKTTGDPAKAEFVLRMGKEFDPTQIEAVPPWEFVGEPEKVGGSLRNLKYKAKLNIVGTVIAPVIPGDKKIKQYVNLPTASNGQDGNSHTVKFKVGIKDDPGRDPADRIGKAGVFLFVEVEYGADGTLKKSKRNNPEPRLRQTGDVSGWTQVTPRVKFKAKVELKGPDGTGEFEVVVGKAGGDTCKVKIGGTEACADAEVTFTNWRKIYYEIVAPDFMDLEDQDLPAGGRGLGFVAAGKGNVKGSGDATFIEYALAASHSFTEAECPPGTVMDKAFFEIADGNEKVYVLTDYTFTLYPKAINKAGGNSAITSYLKACDLNYYSDGPGRDNPVLRTWDTEAAATALDLPLNIYWVPISGYARGAGRNTVSVLKWKAKLTAPIRPKVTISADVYQALTQGRHTVLRVLEENQNQSIDVVFNNPTIGFVDTSVVDEQMNRLRQFVRGLCAYDVLKATANELKFQITGEEGILLPALRFRNVKAALQTLAAEQVGYHPGMNPDGSPREGNPGVAMIDMPNSTHKKIAIALTAGDDFAPASFVGPATTENKCPVSITLEYEPHHAANGLAGQGAQVGEILVKWGFNCPLCITDTFLHELGHQYKLTPYQTADGHFAPGMRRPKESTQVEDIADYQTNGTKGHYYDNAHGHSGTHCAFGLSDSDKGQANYGGKNGTCTMYGEGGRDDSTRKRLKFCPQCVDYIRARDLSALR